MVSPSGQWGSDGCAGHSATEGVVGRLFSALRALVWRGMQAGFQESGTHNGHGAGCPHPGSVSGRGGVEVGSEIGRGRGA